ncbi:hypothetical protein H696_05491 [Fonticula alba]|uniref:Peptidase M14 domain-containing protein n=1 Tax=Fonticula alba TaxID=691883 RepID=A0A058Z288_FONAL|nr:hypothetical protein H696_05491 [Fonticula alba]KCV68023.1 hypothetical protein H696_05491 [Fonticula alba]|eukprot:XP_009497590.1 hypothetical protein H696_05491 [Fonticula alba]
MALGVTLKVGFALLAASLLGFASPGAAAAATDRYEVDLPADYTGMPDGLPAYAGPERLHPAEPIRSHTGSRFYRVHVQSQRDAAALAEAAEALHLDLMGSIAVPGEINVLVPADSLVPFRRLSLRANVLGGHADAAQMIEAARVENDRARFESFATLQQVGIERFGLGVDNDPWYDAYHSLNETYAWLDDLEAAYPAGGLVSVERVSAGRTYLGNDQAGVRIKVRGATPRKAAVIIGGEHAREWVTIPTVQGVLQTFLERAAAGDQEILEYLSKIDWHFFPVFNPDGYDHSWTSDRLWRKNRVPNKGSVCVGTDINRNWGKNWNTGGSSPQPCSDAYHGTGAFSAHESRNMNNYLMALQRTGVHVLSFIDQHAYSQLWMYPPGFTCSEVTPEHDLLEAVGTACADAIYQAGFQTVYKAGTICRIIYQASGGSVDHTYYNLDIPFSYAIEGRDVGRHGFELPPAQIRPSVIETFEAYRVLGRAFLDY